MMMGEPKPPGTVMVDMNDEDLSEQASIKMAILKKIIKIDDLPDPVALYGADTESEEPPRAIKQPFSIDKRTTRRQTQLQQQPGYFIRGKEEERGFKFMYLKNNTKAICPDKVSDEKEWNFTGKPITQVIQERK
jgi:hypothetical protein